MMCLASEDTQFERAMLSLQSSPWGHDVKGAVDAGGVVLLLQRYKHVGSQAGRWQKAAVAGRLEREEEGDELHISSFPAHIM